MGRIYEEKHWLELLIYGREVFGSGLLVTLTALISTFQETMISHDKDRMARGQGCVARCVLDMSH